MPSCAARPAPRPSRSCADGAHAPGVLAYDDGEVVGWAGISPVAELHEYGSKRYPEADDQERTWVLWCFRVRAGHGRKGIATALVEAATDYATSKGAAEVVGYPLDNDGGKVDRTLASVGTRRMFEQAGFTVDGHLDGKRDGFRQAVMRRSF